MACLVLIPLFAAFGPEPIRARLALANAKVLVTTPVLYERKVASFASTLPHLQHILLISEDQQATTIERRIDLHALMSAAN